MDWDNPFLNLIPELYIQANTYYINQEYGNARNLLNSLDSNTLSVLKYNLYAYFGYTNMDPIGYIFMQQYLEKKMTVEEIYTNQVIYSTEEEFNEAFDYIAIWLYCTYAMRNMALNRKAITSWLHRNM